MSLMGDSDPDKEKASFLMQRILYTGRLSPVSPPVSGQEFCISLSWSPESPCLVSCRGRGGDKGQGFREGCRWPGLAVCFVLTILLILRTAYQVVVSISL